MDVYVEGYVLVVVLVEEYFVGLVELGWVAVGCGE